MDDLCDQCGVARAFLWAEYRSGASIALCGHHATAGYDALVLSGANIIDLRHMVGAR